MMTRFGKSSGAVKIGVLVAGLFAFFVGIVAATSFTSGLSSRFVPLAVVLLAIGLIVYKFKKSGCCSG